MAIGSGTNIFFLCTPRTNTQTAANNGNVTMEMLTVQLPSCTFVSDQHLWCQEYQRPGLKPPLQLPNIGFSFSQAAFAHQHKACLQSPISYTLL